MNSLATTVATPSKWPGRAAPSKPSLTPKTTTEADKLLRTLAQVRRQGWALVNEELELGLMSLAVPLQDRAGRVVAAINVSSRPQQQPAAEMQRRYLPLLQAVAERLGSLLPR